MKTITNVITIPKKLAQKDDLVVLPRRKYEELVIAGIKKITEFQPTVAQKRALKQARENFKKGNFLTLNELRKKLGFAN